MHGPPRPSVTSATARRMSRIFLVWAGMGLSFMKQWQHAIGSPQPYVSMGWWLTHQEQTVPLPCRACCPAGVGSIHGSVWAPVGGGPLSRRACCPAGVRRIHRSVWAPVGGGRAFFGIRADRLLEGLSHTVPWGALPHQEKTLSLLRRACGPAAIRFHWRC